MFICLEKYDAERHQHRFYALSIQPHLFGGWSLVCEWGRIGQPGRVHIAMHASEAQAQAAFDKKLREKQPCFSAM